MDWPSQWAANERSFIARDIDPNLARDARILKAAQQLKFFKKSWPKDIWYLWDQFRIYAGLLWEPPVWHFKGNQHSQNMGGEGGTTAPIMILEAKGEEAGPSSKPANGGFKIFPSSRAPHSCCGQPPIVLGSQEEIRQLILQTKDEQLNRRLRFANDITSSIRIFLSDYIFDNHLHLAPGNLKVIPHLLHFFLRFLYRSNVLTDAHDIQDLRNALHVVSTACTELPLIHKLRQSLPDKWSLACENTWRSKAESTFVGHSLQGRQTQTCNLGQKRMLESHEDSKGSVANKRRRLDEDIDDEDVDMTCPEEGLLLMSANDFWDDESSDPDSDETWEREEGSLTPMAFLGPTTLPLTHSVGIVERSIRRISAVLPPEPEFEGRGVEAEMRRRLARVVMAPWKQGLDQWRKFGPDVLSTPSGHISDGDVMDVDGHGPMHNPSADPILLCIDPIHFKTFKECLGMSICATWVQTVRLTGRGKRSSSQEASWYMEFVTDVLPSFYLQSIPIDV